MKKSIHMAVTAALTLGTLSVGGQTYAADQDLSADEHSLGETVVTATRTPNKELKADADITVITGRDIERRHYTDLTQALRDVPGVTFRQYAPAGYNNSSNFYINGSEHVVIMIDGVRQNYAGGPGISLSSSMTDLSGIERIEVLRGSASTLYGSDAKGGVINIITKKADRLKTTVEAAYGSYGRQLYSMANEGGANGWDWRVKYQKDKSGDFKDAHGRKVSSHLDANSINVHFGKQLSKASYLAFDLRSYRDQNRYAALWESDVKDGEVNHVHGDFHWNVQIDDTTKNQMSYGRSKYDYTSGGGYGFAVWTTKFSDQFDKRLGDHLLTAGFDFTKDETHRSELANTGLLNRSFYLQDQWSIQPSLKLTAGIRHDSNSGFGSHNSPSVSLGYDIDPVTHAYVSYSGYFITPTPYQLYGKSSWGDPGNPNLKPESGNTREIGLAHDFSRGMNLTASYFMRHSKDRIDYVSGKYANVGDQDAHGWTLQLAKRIDSHLRARVGYTKIHVGAAGARAVNIDGMLPEDQWNIGVDYGNRDFDSSLLVRGVVGRYGPSDAIGDFYPATNYWVVDLAMNYQIADATKIYLKANNIFNQFYAEQSNARSSYWGAAAGQWWTAPGRNFMIGVEQSF